MHWDWANAIQGFIFGLGFGVAYGMAQALWTLRRKARERRR